MDKRYACCGYYRQCHGAHYRDNNRKHSHYLYPANGLLYDQYGYCEQRANRYNGTCGRVCGSHRPTCRQCKWRYLDKQPSYNCIYRFSKRHCNRSNARHNNYHLFIRLWLHRD